MAKKEIVKKQITKNIKSLKNLPASNENEAPNFFVKVLAIVSIMGFAAIISKSWFDFELTPYVEALILLVLGIGVIMESEPKILFNKQIEIDRRNFSRLTTFIIGAIAALAGFLSLPFINLEHFVFLSIKGVISFIAIIFIAVQTWLIKENGTNH